MRKTPVFLMVSLLTLAGCGEPSKSSGTSAAADTTITGIVLNDDTPVVKGAIEATDRNGKSIAHSGISADSHYEITLPAGTAFPVVLNATVAGEATPLKAAVTSELVTEQDISSVTTIVVDTAINLGGITETNLAKAAGAAISQRRSSGGSGGSAGFKGDPTKQYGGWH